MGWTCPGSPALSNRSDCAIGRKRGIPSPDCLSYAGPVWVAGLKGLAKLSPSVLEVYDGPAPQKVPR